jgi:hypothetical protein
MPGGRLFLVLPAIGLGALLGASSCTKGTSVQPTPPSVVVVPASVSISSAQQTGSAQVTANTTWTAASSQPWLTIGSSAAGGSGTTSLSYVVEASTGPARSGTITIAHGTAQATLTVNQAAGIPVPTPTVAIAALSPSPAALGASAQTGTATVSAAGLASWSATSDAEWLTVNDPASGGAGSATLAYAAEPNASTSSRLGRITISASGATPATLTVTQEGRPIAPRLTIAALAPNPATLSASPQTGTATVSATDVTSWAAGSNVSWLTIVSGGSGNSGTSVLTYAIEPNCGPTSRQALITISAPGAAAVLLTVTQHGVPLEAAPAAQVNLPGPPVR